MRHATRLLLGALLLLSAACESARPTAPSLAPEPEGPTISLVVSGTDLRAGDELMVTATYRPDAPGERAGSFGADLRYDPAALRYLGAAPLGDGLRLANAGEEGRVRVAGANPDGFADGRLYAARFLVLRAGGGTSLSLDVRQLGTVTFRNALSRLQARQVGAEVQP